MIRSAATDRAILIPPGTKDNTTMRQKTQNRRHWPWLGGALFAVLFCMSGSNPTLAAPPVDPVEALRQALPVRLEDLAKPTPVATDFRKKALKERVEALKTVSDLRRGLALREWEEDPSRVINDDIRKIDADARQEIGRRLTETIRLLVARGDAHSRLAAANLIAEMGPTIRSMIKDDRTGYVRSLTPEVVKLTEDKDLGVRQEALRALGNIFPKPKDATAVFARVLEKDTLEPKRLASAGLVQLIKVVSFLQKRGRATAGIEAYRADVLETAAEAVAVSKLGLKDPDPYVRISCLMAVQAAAQALTELIPDGFSKKEFPPEGRPLSDDERKDLAKLFDVLRKDIEEIRPLLVVFRAQEPGLVEALSADPEARVRLAAAAALEAVASARLRLQRRVLSVPAPDKEKEKGMLDELASADPLPGFMKKHINAVNRLLSDPDVRVRRTMIDFLENLEEQAEPALPALIHNLGNSDRFVRWAAVRAIGVMNVDKVATAVPALAKLLSDPDLNVRLAAAATLEFLGDKAKDAAPALARAAVTGDVESRLAVLYVLQSMNPEWTKLALPQVIDGLGHADPRLRRLAAETLGKMGPLAAPAIPALRRALGDEDQGEGPGTPNVRSNASDAILSIIPLPK